MVIVTALAGVPARPATAQVLRLIPRQTRLGSSYDGNWRTNAGLTDRSFTQNNFRQWVVLPFDGSIGRPSLVRYRFEFQPTFTQQRSTDLPNPLISRNLAYMADATVLASSPVSLQTHYSRTAGLRQGGFGTQGEFETIRFSPTLHIQNRLLPITVSYTDNSYRNITQVGPTQTPIEQSDATQSFRAAASNRKIDIAYERTAFDDRIYENDFGAESFHVNHTLRWGKRSELLSRYQRTNRTGTLPYERASWSENVRLQHTASTYTRLGMNRYDTEGLGGMSSGEAYTWAMFSDIRPWLGVGGDASRSMNRFDGGMQTATSAGPQVRFGVHLPLGLYFSGGGSIGVIWRDLDDAGDRFVAVLRESYTVDPTGLVILEQTDVEVPSVVVLSGDETTLFIEGLDYRLIAVGALVQIEILAGSRVAPGDAILVSYRFRPEIAAEERGTVGSLDLGLRIDGISAQHTRSRRSTSMSEGLITGDFKQQNTSFRMQRKLPVGMLRMTLSHRKRESTNIDYTASEANVSLGLPPWRSTTLSIEGVVRGVEEGADRLSLYALNGIATWEVLASLRLRASAGYQYWEQRLTEPQRIVSATAALEYAIGQTQVRANYAFDRRSMLYLTSGNRLSLYLLRRF
ncbi:MAG: hypothetical protein SH809_03860 [Rhodothermales bacterium]|nr:hypothetical protein [Rhodothermales bacterium]